MEMGIVDRSGRILYIQRFFKHRVCLLTDRNRSWSGLREVPDDAVRNMLLAPVSNMSGKTHAEVNEPY